MNIRDIAREAGVSIATVSRVLNSSATVGAQTRARVQAVIKAHGYTANALARGLLQNRTRTFGIITATILNPYHAAVVHALKSAAKAMGGSALLCETEGSAAEEQRQVRSLLERRMDGLVFLSSVFHEAGSIEEVGAAAKTVPIVMINTRIEAPNVRCLLCDDDAGMRLATDHLLSTGRDRILFLNAAGTPGSRQKEEAFSRACEAAGLPASHITRVEVKGDEFSSLPWAIEAAFATQGFSAVLATDDLLASLAMNALHSLHIPIPGRVAVVGYNDSHVSRHSHPRLTTVDSRIQAMADSCADILDRSLAGERGIGNLSLFKPRLVLRESSGYL
jgi:DNA-binding LacI/PurR family transcriptional regulator